MPRFTIIRHPLPLIKFWCIIKYAPEFDQRKSDTDNYLDLKCWHLWTKCPIICIVLPTLNQNLQLPILMAGGFDHRTTSCYLITLILTSVSCFSEADMWWSNRWVSIILFWDTNDVCMILNFRCSHNIRERDLPISNGGLNILHWTLVSKYQLCLGGRSIERHS